jgi:ribonuclease HI
MTVQPLVAVYADESCLGNGRDGASPGGAAGVVEYHQPRTGKILRRDYWIAEPDTTNNRMALRSVTEAFRALARSRVPLRVVFTSDSLYLVKGLREWVHDWARRGWTRSARGGRGHGAPIENLALWGDALAAIRESGHAYDWQWVRGHHGHAQNEYANFLAMRAASEQHDSSGLVESGFDAWLATAKRVDPPAAFPDAAAFHPARLVPSPPPAKR